MELSSDHKVTNFCPGAFLKFALDLWETQATFLLLFYICMLCSEGEYLHKAVSSSGLY